MKRIGRTVHDGPHTFCEVGVMLDGYPAPVIELTVVKDGRWELVQREYGNSGGKTLAKGRIELNG